MRRFVTESHRNHMKFFSYILAAGLLAPGIGIAQQDESSLPQDYEITDYIQQDLEADTGVPEQRVQVLTTDGTVTLTGTVRNAAQKQRAERIAATAKGVENVVNDIEVAPLEERSDDAILTDVKASVRMNRDLSTYELNVSVEDGVVTLTGDVQSWKEYQLYGQLARAVRGVREVDNQIMVSRVQRREADIMENEIKQNLRYDSRIDHELITVSVEDDRVSLEGTVASLAEKRLAIEHAQIDGVQIVYGDNLEVADWARTPSRRERKYRNLTEQNVISAVENALEVEPWVDAENIDVLLDNGTAFLQGEVNSLRGKRMAAETAGNIIGVWNVINQLNVTSENRPENKNLAERVQKQLKRNIYLEDTDISVTANDGDIRLRGFVDSSFEKAKAEELASSVDGVLDIRNRLKIEDETDPGIFNTYVDPWTEETFSWLDYNTRNTTYKADPVLYNDVRQELWWSPFVNSDEVEVEVNQGEVTLSGTVDTWNEKEIAAENAREAGANVVENNLKVNYEPEISL